MVETYESLPDDKPIQDPSEFKGFLVCARIVKSPGSFASSKPRATPTSARDASRSSKLNTASMESFENHLLKRGNSVIRFKYNATQGTLP